MLSMDTSRGIRSLWLTADQQGMRLFEQGRFAEAAEVFLAAEWRAAAFYKAGAFKEAAGLLQGIDTAEGTYNHGNALCMLGKYADAVRRYERALELRPDWPEAETNLAIARAGAERMDFQGGEMTGGKLAADDYVFSENKSSGQAGEEVIEEGGAPMSDAEMRAVWLRGVQTHPADFLRSKFAYQAAMGDEQ
jgi:Ca-activated chloride channel family protein